jgi:superfamily II DNA or RNA helicase
VIPRRRFSDRERVALYLAADGRCTSCGTELGPGWHADHVTPFSKGGSTDVINGEALCPPCNLSKGDRVSGLRLWQSEALSGFLKNQKDFLLVATPGAGKTIFAIVATQRLIERGEIDRIIVVVPTKHLRRQWALAAARLGVQLDYRFANGAGTLAKDYDGTVVTYQAVASEPLLFRKLSASRTLVVLDEVHHGGDELSWGTALKSAFELATRRLLLSGTPTRTDHAKVPFVEYDEDGKFIWSYKYDYGQALLDRDVVRPIEFLALDGEVRWREAGQVQSQTLADADDDTLSNALIAALNPDGDWITSVLRRADAELTRHRADVSDAGGLVVAADQYRARRYAALLGRISGEEPTVAISDEPDASEKIAQFTRDSSRWLVAVQMVSEGVDIPRLAVGVYASRYKTELFFRQVAGRFVRMRSDEDETTATLLVPSIGPLLRYAQDIERTVARALAEDEMKARRQVKEREGQMSLRLDLVEPIDSSEAVHHSTILAGDSFTEPELQRAMSVLQAARMPASITAAQMARALRVAGAGRVLGTAVVEKPSEAKPLADEKTTMRKLIQRKVGRLNRITDEPYAHIHIRLNGLCGATAKTATADGLNQRLDLLDRWLEQA